MFNNFSLDHFIIQLNKEYDNYSHKMGRKQSSPGWMDGWMGARAALKIAYSNQIFVKEKIIVPRGRVNGCKSRFKD